MNFYTTVLGSGAAVPTMARHCSGQVVNLNGFRMLLDCGENTQTQVRVCHEKMQSLATIFITHLHGDHFFGLPGLLSSMHLCGRTEPVDIFAPAGAKSIMEMLLQVSGSHLAFEMRFHELSHLEGQQPVFENERCRVWAFPLVHSLPTYGYRIEEKPRGASPVRSYAYCTDTVCTETFLPFIRRVNLLCLESTFDNAFAGIAAEKLHCTAAQAAALALKAEAKALLLTHISARYKSPDHLLAEARAVFPNTQIAADGERYGVAY